MEDDMKKDEVTEAPAADMPMDGAEMPAAEVKEDGMEENKEEMPKEDGGAPAAM